jgi:CheY-like chemotaxis protein
VLIVGDDAARRSRMLSELRGLLPSGTPFVEAAETWEVLTHTTGSRMVVLTGGLGEISTHSLMRILSRRHPTLPVIAVGSRTRSSQPADAGIALV